MKPIARLNPGNTLCCLNWLIFELSEDYWINLESSGNGLFQINLVEDAAITEMNLMNIFPITEGIAYFE